MGGLSHYKRQCIVAGRCAAHREGRLNHPANHGRHAPGRPFQARFLRDFLQPNLILNPRPILAIYRQNRQQ